MLTAYPIELVGSSNFGLALDKDVKCDAQGTCTPQNEAVRGQYRAFQTQVNDAAAAIGMPTLWRTDLDGILKATDMKIAIYIAKKVPAGTHPALDFLAGKDDNKPADQMLVLSVVAQDPLQYGNALSMVRSAAEKNGLAKKPGLPWGWIMVGLLVAASAGAGIWYWRRRAR